MASSLLYGAKECGIDTTALAISSRLGCTFENRESGYFGEYKLASFGAMDIKIVAQPDPEGDPLEDEFEDYHILVYVDSDGEAPDLDGLQIAAGRLERLRME